VRFQYLLAFESAREAGWRALDVRTRNETHTVRARGAYMAGAVRPEAIDTTPFRVSPERARNRLVRNAERTRK
jgi:hypothetical protein